MEKQLRAIRDPAESLILGADSAPVSQRSILELLSLTAYLQILSIYQLY